MTGDRNCLPTSVAGAAAGKPPDALAHADSTATTQDAGVATTPFHQRGRRSTALRHCGSGTGGPPPWLATDLVHVARGDGGPGRGLPCHRAGPAGIGGFVAPRWRLRQEDPGAGCLAPGDVPGALRLGHDWGGPVAFALAAQPGGRETPRGVRCSRAGRWHSAMFESLAPRPALGTGLPRSATRGREDIYLGFFTGALDPTPYRKRRNANTCAPTDSPQCVPAIAPPRRTSPTTNRSCPRANCRSWLRGRRTWRGSDRILRRGPWGVPLQGVSILLTGSGTSRPVVAR